MKTCELYEEDVLIQKECRDVTTSVEPNRTLKSSPSVGIKYGNILRS